MNLVHVIGELYRLRIDCGFESYQGNGVVAWIVDAGNRRIEQHFGIEELDAIGEWLHANGFKGSGIDEEPVARSLLAGLADSPRKDPKRVTADERRTTVRSQTAKTGGI